VSREREREGLECRDFDTFGKRFEEIGRPSKKVSAETIVQKKHYGACLFLCLVLKEREKSEREGT